MSPIFKVVNVDAGPEQSLNNENEQLRPLCVEIIRGRSDTKEKLIENVQDADAILVAGTAIDREVLEGLDKCKVVVRYGVGVDNIDLAAATEQGIVVAHVPDFCTEEVSTHALALLLACGRQLRRLDAGIHSGGWFTPALPHEVKRETLGIIGIGRIGGALARKARPLEMNIIAYDPYLDDAVIRERGAAKVSLEELLKTSDYVSLHAPLTPETRHMIGARELAMMKPTAFLINTARGPEVDEAALIEALQKGTIGGAGLDVFETEPLPAESPLRTMENVIMTPHMAFFSPAAVSKLGVEVGRAAAAVLSGHWPKYVANPEVREKISLSAYEEP